MRPSCFDSDEQYLEWLGLCRLSEHDPNNHCHDCSADYQYDMMKAGRCEHPETRFMVVGRGEDAAVVGVAPMAPTPGGIRVVKLAACATKTKPPEAS